MVFRISPGFGNYQSKTNLPVRLLRRGLLIILTLRATSSERSISAKHYGELGTDSVCKEYVVVIRNSVHNLRKRLKDLSGARE